LPDWLGVTTEQLIILALFAAAFLAGWIARALIGGGSRAGASPRMAKGEPARGSVGQRFEGAVHESRHELARATHAYHAAVVRSLRNGKESGSSESSLEALAGALVALSRAVDHASTELEAQHPLSEKLQSTGLELRRLADDVMRHSRERELPTGVFDQLEQHLISAASIIFTSDRLKPRAT
jgi:hypothetical protein